MAAFALLLAGVGVGVLALFASDALNATLDRRTIARDAGECRVYDTFLRQQLPADQRAVLLELRASRAQRAVANNADSSPCLLPAPAAGDPERTTP
jgi:hypothetical protein